MPVFQQRQRLLQWVMLLLLCATFQSVSTTSIRRGRTLQQVQWAPPICNFETINTSTSTTPSPALNHHQQVVIGIGFLKTGTTALSNCLRSHVIDSGSGDNNGKWCPHPTKELRYLNSLQVLPCVLEISTLPTRMMQHWAPGKCGEEKVEEIERRYRAMLTTGHRDVIDIRHNSNDNNNNNNNIIIIIINVEGTYSCIWCCC